MDLAASNALETSSSDISLFAFETATTPCWSGAIYAIRIFQPKRCQSARQQLSRLFPGTLKLMTQRLQCCLLCLCGRPRICVSAAPNICNSGTPPPFRSTSCPTAMRTESEPMSNPLIKLLCSVFRHIDLYTALFQRQTYYTLLKQIYEVWQKIINPIVKCDYRRKQNGSGHKSFTT